MQNNNKMVESLSRTFTLDDFEGPERSNSRPISTIEWFQAPG